MVLSALAAKLGLAKLKVAEGAFPPGAFYKLQAKTLDGKPFHFEALKGKAVLITNVACACGFTKSNYTQLVALHEKYKSDLEILAFPSNEFGAQEPGAPDEIREFVNKYGVKFTMMEKTNVNGPQTHPVYVALKEATKTQGDDVTWNFETKFLVDRNGQSVVRFSKAFDPDKLIPFIDQVIKGAPMSTM